MSKVVTDIKDYVAGDIIKFEFENPNSINNHWLRSAKGMFISKQGKIFRQHVIDIVDKAGFKDLKLENKLKYKAVYHRHDARRCDLDNFCTKAVFDALTHSGIWLDDSQLDEISYSRGDLTKDKISRLVVYIQEI